MDWFTEGRSKYLAIFRATHNFVLLGDDGKTPAMRLGLSMATENGTVLAIENGTLLRRATRC